MKLFQGITTNKARIKVIQTQQTDIVELTATDLVCFGLMTDQRLLFKLQSLRFFREQGPSKRYFIKVELNNNQSDVRQLLNEYRIRVVEDNKWTLIELKQSQYDKLSIICLENSEEKKKAVLAGILQDNQIQFVYLKQKLFVSRKEYQVLDLLEIQISQIDAFTFNLNFQQSDPYLYKIIEQLDQHSLTYQISTRHSKEDQKLIHFAIEIVNRYKRNPNIKDKDIKQYLRQKMKATALLLTTFQKLNIDFDFIPSAEMKRYTVTLLSPTLSIDFKKSIANVPPLGQKLSNWSDQNYEVILDNFIQKIEKTDFTNISYFFSTVASQYSKFEQDLMFIADNWNIYSLKLEDKMKEVQDLIDFKVFTLQEYKLIYPNLQKIVERIQLRTGYVGSKKFVMKTVTDDITDTLYIHFFQQLQARTLRHSPFYIKDQRNGAKLLLADVIASKIEYNSQAIQNAYWQDIFQRVRLHVKRMAAYSKSTDQKTSSDQKANIEFSNNIEKQRLIDLGCLACCPIFYTDYNIYDPLVNKTPIELVQKITKLTDLQNDVKDKICYLLNNQGGVVLFDVAPKYRDFIPLGEIFTKKDQQAYIQKIESIIQTISPKPVIRQNIEISFVPIVKNPMLNPIKQKIQAKKTQNSFETVYYSRPYVQGMFVTRIKVKPTTPWRTYYWTNGDKVIVPQKVNSTTIKAMSGRKIHKYMADKFKKHYIPEDLPEQQKQLRELLMPRVSCFHPGKCTEPDAGLPIYQIKIQKQGNEDPETKYPYMSLLIARKVDHQTIKQRLRRKAIDCEIVNLYKDQNFKAANNSAAIYHSVRFDHLLSEISYNRDFEFAGRYAMVIFISQFLKLPDYHRKNYMSQASFRSLQAWVKKYHPKEWIRFWRYDTGETEEFYLQTQSRKSTVLMYYVMTQFGQKCIFKNPKNFDRLTQEQKDAKIKVIYPLKTANPNSYGQGEQVQVQKNVQVQPFKYEEGDEYFWHDQAREETECLYKSIIQKKIEILRSA